MKLELSVLQFVIHGVREGRRIANRQRATQFGRGDRRIVDLGGCFSIHVHARKSPSILGRWRREGCRVTLGARAGRAKVWRQGCSAGSGNLGWSRGRVAVPG
jgi:hypothetical protein